MDITPNVCHYRPGNSSPSAHSSPLISPSGDDCNSLCSPFVPTVFCVSTMFVCYYFVNTVVDPPVSVSAVHVFLSMSVLSMSFCASSDMLLYVRDHVLHKSLVFIIIASSAVVSSFMNRLKSILLHTSKRCPNQSITSEPDITQNLILLHTFFIPTDIFI